MKTNKKGNKMARKVQCACSDGLIIGCKELISIKLPPLKAALRKDQANYVTRNHNKMRDQCIFPNVDKRRFFDTCSNFFIRKTLYAEFNRLDNYEHQASTCEDSFDELKYGKRPETRSTSESPVKGAIDIHFGGMPLKSKCSDWMLCRNEEIN